MTKIMRLIQKQIQHNYDAYDGYYQYTQNFNDPDDPLRQTLIGLRDYDMFASMSSQELDDYIADNFAYGPMVNID